MMYLSFCPISQGGFYNSDKLDWCFRASRVSRESRARMHEDCVDRREFRRVT